MPHIQAARSDHPTADDLINFLKAIPDDRYRRGFRDPQWFLLLVAILGILSGCHSCRALDALPGGFAGQGGTGADQGELAWLQLDHRAEQHQLDPQRQVGSTRPVFHRYRAKRPRSPATADPPALGHGEQGALSPGRPAR